MRDGTNVQRRIVRKLTNDLIHFRGLHFELFINIRHFARNHPHQTLLKPGSVGHRIKSACTGCVRRKVKCDNSEPVCGQCLKRADECLPRFDTKPRNRMACDKAVQENLMSFDFIESNDLTAISPLLRMESPPSPFRDLSDTKPEIALPTGETFNGEILRHTPLYTQPTIQLSQPQRPFDKIDLDQFGGSCQDKSSNRFAMDSADTSPHHRTTRQKTVDTMAANMADLREILAAPGPTLRTSDLQVIFSQFTEALYTISFLKKADFEQSDSYPTFKFTNDALYCITSLLQLEDPRLSSYQNHLQSIQSYFEILTSENVL